MSAHRDPGCLPVLAYLGLFIAFGLVIKYAPQLTAWLTAPVQPWMRWVVILAALTVVLGLIVWAAAGSHGADGRDA